MKNNGYDAFFKAAKENRKKPNAAVKPKKPSSAASAKKKTLDEYTEQELRKIFKMQDSQKTSFKTKKKTKKQSFPAGGLALTSTLILLSSIYFLLPDEIESSLPKIKWSFFTAASAQDQEKTDKKDPVQGEKTSENQEAQAANQKSEKNSWSEEDVSYFSKLNERKQELDLREKELGELEQELNKQKAEIEARIQYLEKVRGDIALVLQDRVEVDEKKVEKLVQFYSNMKPGQAAQIISGINEDLAIGVLSKMKKKNAAAILNLIEAKKAKKLSEKFAGYTAR